jgi:hypothetical protein
MLCLTLSIIIMYEGLGLGVKKVQATKENTNPKIPGAIITGAIINRIVDLGPDVKFRPGKE